MNKSYLVRVKTCFSKQVSACFSLILLFLMSIAIISCEEKVKEPSQLVSDGEGLPVETIRGLETLYSDSGKVKVRVKAPLYYKTTDNQTVTTLPKGIRIEFYNNEMKIESELTADWAVHKENERVWEARNKVVVINKKGERLDTERLVWDERKERLTSDRDVKITTSEEIIYGGGFEANQDFSNYRIFNVKGRINVKK